MDNFQLSASNLRAVGYGKARLKNKAAPPASENRRVEVVVPEWWLAIGDSSPSRVQCRIRSRVSAGVRGERSELLRDLADGQWHPHRQCGRFE
jgi:hypothetical protein